MNPGVVAIDPAPIIAIFGQILTWGIIGAVVTYTAVASIDRLFPPRR